MFRKSSFSLIILFLNLNCATFVFYPDYFETVPEKRATVLLKKTIGVNVLYKLFNDDVEETPVLNHQKDIERMMKNSISKAGYTVDDPKGGQGSADANCDIVYTNKVYPHGGLSFLAGMTLFALPTQVSTNVIIDISFKDKSGKLLKSYQRSAETFNWIGWLFLPFMPFYFTTSEINDMNFQLVSSILREAAKDNVLK
ncbi:hypothetical protein CH371_18645 [Leptospira wolffii]|uniref:Uncharacterized protein n=2 Tax=Leptospira wolffii TaxID=409998 RepID=A0A2M9Z7X6_9LEPT|nr:hypothetical protein CH371_18645 [Leptospira wolffii]